MTEDPLQTILDKILEFKTIPHFYVEPLYCVMGTNFYDRLWFWMYQTDQTWFIDQAQEMKKILINGVELVVLPGYVGPTITGPPKAGSIIEEMKE